MSRNVVYRTKQKNKILDAIKRNNHEFTIKDIYYLLNEEVGLTTIYRFVDKLVSNGSVSKYIKDDNITYYQYLEECDKDNHFYLKCDSCGNLIHVDCDCVNELFSHIFNKHYFKPYSDKFIINGICCNCGGDNDV